MSVTFLYKTPQICDECEKAPAVLKCRVCTLTGPHYCEVCFSRLPAHQGGGVTSPHTADRLQPSPGWGAVTPVQMHAGGGGGARVSALDSELLARIGQCQKTTAQVWFTVEERLKLRHDDVVAGLSRQCADAARAAEARVAQEAAGTRSGVCV